MLVACYCLGETKVLVPHTAFSDTTSMLPWEVGGTGRSLGSPSGYSWIQGFSVVAGCCRAVFWKFFILLICIFRGTLTRYSRLFLGLILSVPVDVPSSHFLVLSWEFMMQRENSGNSVLWYFLCSNFSCYFAASLYIPEPSCVCLNIISRSFHCTYQK